jgi:hypothetical protein
MKQKPDDEHKFLTESSRSTEEQAKENESGALPGNSTDPVRVVRHENVGRNEPCPCGSGKKYKKCCLQKQEELARQSVAAQTPEPMQTYTKGTLSEKDSNSAQAAEEASDTSPSHEDAGWLSDEIGAKLDAIWDRLKKLDKPTVGQMDEFVSKLLSVATEGIPWSEVLHYLAGAKHPDLPGVFRRIVAAVPHTKSSRMGFFYWAAAEEFTRQGAPHLLPEVAAGFRKLDLDSYDPDALSHVEDVLLAAGFEAEALRLAEHFLSVERADEDLMPFAVPERCSLIFELRVGLALGEEPSAVRSPDDLVKQLRLDIEEEIHEDSARLAAEIVCGTRADPAWERPQFVLVTGDISTDDAAWQGCLRLFGVLIRVAREAWLIEARPPGGALRSLMFLQNSVYPWENQRSRKSKKSKGNLLDYLRPSGIEGRLVQSCNAIIGVNRPRGRLLLQGHELLARFAARHQLITPADCAETEKEVARLLHCLRE